MAQIIKKASGLEAEYKQNIEESNRLQSAASKWGFGLVGGAVLVLIGFLTAELIDNLTVTAVLLVLGGIIFLISAVCAGSYSMSAITQRENNSVLGAGIIGEEATAAIVNSLPDGYIGFQNTVVTFDGQKSEMDMVIVGPTGVYIIETKNHNGTIYGGYEDRNWIQHKVGRRGTPYQNEIYSPVKQVGTHIYRLANYLRSNGARVHVDGMVYFANPEAMLQLRGKPDKIPVFSASGSDYASINRYIISGPQVLDNNMINKVANLVYRAH